MFQFLKRETFWLILLCGRNFKTTVMYGGSVGPSLFTIQPVVSSGNNLLLIAQMVFSSKGSRPMSSQVFSCVLRPYCVVCGSTTNDQSGSSVFCISVEKDSDVVTNSVETLHHL